MIVSRPTLLGVFAIVRDMASRLQTRQITFFRELFHKPV